jgi:hypothetical protein
MTLRWMRRLAVTFAVCSCHHDAAVQDATPVTVIPTLNFAVTGDTRPPILEDVTGYPTAIITQIFQDVAAENPAVAFVIATGDYMFTVGASAQAMADLYMGARAEFPGPMYPAMGNHECNSLTEVNCAGAPTTNTNVFIDTMLSPLQEILPYYQQRFAATDGSWTANFVFVACNSWDSTQQNWLQSVLAQPATYTFVVRHEDVADLGGSDGGPCTESQPIIDSNPLTLLLVGHVHEYFHSAPDKELLDGLGGAPLDSGTNYGYTLVTRNSDGTLTVTTKDYMLLTTIDSFTIDANGSGV